MLERMTDATRHSLVIAGDEARRLGHDHIATEHLLLGLVHREGGVASVGLRAIGIQPSEVRDAVLEVALGSPQVVTAKSLPYTPRAKRVLELSLREALQLGHGYINQGHLILALVTEGEGIAAEVLRQLAGDFQSKRAAFIAAVWPTTPPAPSKQSKQSDDAPSQKVREIGPIEIENGDVVIRTSNRFIEIASDQEHGDIQELYISMEKPDGTPTTLTIKFDYDFDGKQN